MLVACAGLAVLIGGFCNVYAVYGHHKPDVYEQRYATDDGGPEYILVGQHEFESLVKGGYCPGGVRTVRYRDVKVVAHLCEM